jgi:hypothetical protein
MVLLAEELGVEEILSQTFITGCQAPGGIIRDSIHF